MGWPGEQEHKSMWGGHFRLASGSLESKVRVEIRLCSVYTVMLFDSGDIM